MEQLNAHWHDPEAAPGFPGGADMGVDVGGGFGTWADVLGVVKVVAVAAIAVQIGLVGLRMTTADAAEGPLLLGTIQWTSTDDREDRWADYAPLSMSAAQWASARADAMEAAADVLRDDALAAVDVLKALRHAEDAASGDLRRAAADRGAVALAALDLRGEDAPRRHLELQLRIARAAR